MVIVERMMMMMVTYCSGGKDNDCHGDGFHMTAVHVYSDDGLIITCGQCRDAN